MFFCILSYLIIIGQFRRFFILSTHYGKKLNVTKTKGFFASSSEGGEEEEMEEMEEEIIEQVCSSPAQNPLMKPLCIESEKKDATFLNNPGIYELRDTVNDKSYYGESACLMHRLDSHRRELAQGHHENSGLNNAIQNGITIDDIQFIVLDCGPEWALLDHRKAREDAYIRRNANRCYNFDESTPPQTRIIRPFMAYNTRYRSTRAAVKGEAQKGRPVGRSTIRRYLRDPNNTDFVYLDNEATKFGEIPIFGKKENTPSLLFNSYTECIAAGFASNKQNARRKIQRKETGWKYAHLDAEGKPLRIPYTLKEGEIKYTEWIKNQSTERGEL